jgi:hypothetical protein
MYICITMDNYVKSTATVGDGELFILMITFMYVRMYVCM